MFQFGGVAVQLRSVAVRRCCSKERCGKGVAVRGFCSAAKGCFSQEVLK